MFSPSKPFVITFVFLFLLWPSSDAFCDDSFDDFPTPLGGEWGQIYLSDSSAASIVDIPGGYADSVSGIYDWTAGDLFEDD